MVKQRMNIAEFSYEFKLWKGFTNDYHKQYKS